MNKLAKPAHPPLCVITNHPARYRDPKTGLPYYNSYAFKEIQRLYRGEYKWSRLLGAWMGIGTLAAKGVPERFLDPNSKEPEPDVPTPPASAEATKGKEPGEEQEDNLDQNLDQNLAGHTTMPTNCTASGSELIL